MVADYRSMDGVPIAGRPWRRFCVLCLLVPALATQAAGAPEPQLVTQQTMADPVALAVLQEPGQVLFQDDFESEASLKKYFEIRGIKEGHARLVGDEEAHSGSGAMRFTAPSRDGESSGSGASGWLGAQGYDTVYYRRYIYFASDYDQGDLNHTGGGLAGVAGSNKWGGMGKAGLLPKGDDRFTSRFEPWRDWGRYPAPGYMFLYTYWMDMKRDRDGHYWGNMLGPEPENRITPERGRWICMEQMIKVNTPGQWDGELAAWIDGELYIHYRGIRWRSTASVRIKRFNFGVYIHKAVKDNTVWYDDVVLSTGYVGPAERDNAVPAMQ